MAYELNGTTFEADEEGYLVDIGAWNKELAELIAKDERTAYTHGVRFGSCCRTGNWS